MGKPTRQALAYEAWLQEDAMVSQADIFKYTNPYRALNCSYSVLSSDTNFKYYYYYLLYIIFIYNNFIIILYMICLTLSGRLQ